MNYALSVVGALVLFLPAVCPYIETSERCVTAMSYGYRFIY